MFAKTRLILHAFNLDKWNKTNKEADGNQFCFEAIVSQSQFNNLELTNYRGLENG